ncbi:CHAD domain-containing protein [Pontibacillus yanchengensis]|uniref:CHAD domain-containing protein n=1 Tax=Pontibacillus yanchengensis TaxID=462910 RepID=A0ACC7VHY0_9BACI|nr:CHAD domain-containing protein [Pontibacillus yanchengensis]MYL54307.1 CHAD domain-containing protein [Pontibacillus yanchengensis]
MDNTSLTLQIDGMGRFVIPKEMRDALGFEDQGLVINSLSKRRGISISKASANTAKKNTKRLDVDGRLLIPAQFRKELGWVKGKELELEIEKDYAVLQESPSRCIICGNKKQLLEVKESFVCEDCLSTANVVYIERWQKGLDKLVHQYKSYCEQALSFEDGKELHQARVKGRRLETILFFIGVGKDHALIERIQEAHDRLGKVRESDVFIDSFKKRAEQEEDSSHAQVYRQFAELREEKREKHQKKLAKNLPEIIDNRFMELWEQFKTNELRNYLLPLKIDERLNEYEQTFKELTQTFNEEVTEKGKNDKSSLKTLHSVRIKAKALRYICKYLGDMYGKPYKKKAKQYKEVQRNLGDINDLRDFLKEIKQNQKKVDVSKQQIQQVRGQLNQELVELLESFEVKELTTTS